MWKPRTATVTLYPGDYQQRIEKVGAAAEAAERRLSAAREAEKKQSLGLTMDDEPPSVALAAEFESLAAAHDDLVEAAEAEGAITVTLQAQPRLKWDELVESNPPRPDNEGDKEIGVNDKALGEALVPLSIVSLSDETVTVEELLAGVSSAQWDLLYGMAFRLNRTLGTDPKDAPRLRPSPSTSATGN